MQVPKDKIRGKIYGNNISEEKASVVLIPVPWETTVSPPSGTARTPAHMLKSSYKINPYNEDYPDYDNTDIAMLPIPKDWVMLSDQLQGIVTGYINSLESATNKKVYSANSNAIAQINKYCEDLKEYVRKQSIKYLNKDKMVGVVGGDHSVCLGLIEALTSKYKDFGILQVDAQTGLSPYDYGFMYSHKSIMNNVLKIPQITKIVQVGLRDYTKEEVEVIKNSNGKIVSFFDANLKKQQYEGVFWKDICTNIVKNLPDLVYINFDIDGLDYKLCPGTALPVPGGMDFSQAIFLIKAIVEAGKTIIGFDLCEVAAGEQIDWDISVANRLMYNIIKYMVISQQKDSKAI